MFYLKGLEDKTIAEPNEEPRIDTVNTSKLVEVVKNNSEHMFIICLMTRPGAIKMFQEVEERFCPFDDDGDNDCHVFIIKWPKAEELQWFMVGFPRKIEDNLRAVVLKYGFNLTHAVPKLVGPDGIETFPIPDLDNTYTLEGQTPGVVAVVMAKSEQEKV